MFNELFTDIDYCDWIMDEHHTLFYYTDRDAVTITMPVILFAN